MAGLGVICSFSFQIRFGIVGQRSVSRLGIRSSFAKPPIPATDYALTLCAMATIKYFTQNVVLTSIPFFLKVTLNKYLDQIRSFQKNQIPLILNSGTGTNITT